jgi:hypothetical protein
VSAISGQTRPHALPVAIENIPDALKEIAHWLVWRYEPKDIDPKTGETRWDKPPISATNGSPGSSTNAQTWTTFAVALDFYKKRNLDGIGFALHFLKGDATRLVAIDLDKCRHTETGVIDEWALKIIQAVKSYTEISPSGRGIRIFLYGALPPFGRKKGPYENYESARYVTVTGKHIDGTPRTIEHRQEQLLAVHREKFGERIDPPVKPTNGTAAALDLDNRELLALAFKSKNGNRIKALYNGDTSGYPSRSEADLAFCNFLAFWCDKDADRMMQIIAESGLYRKKWQRPDYRERTLRLAIEGCQEVYVPTKRGRPRPRSGGGSAQMNGHVAPNSQTEHVAPTSETSPPSAPGDGYTIIKDYFTRVYQPVFRRGAALFAAPLGREVRMGEACSGAGIELIDLLGGATDAPRDRRGNTERSALPYFFRTWAPSAWKDILAGLTEEENSSEIVDRAQEDFRAKVSAALHTLVSMGLTYREDVRQARTEVQQRTLFDWCCCWSKPGLWKKVRSYSLWTRREGDEGRVAIALRVELFSQIKFPELARMTQNKFGRLAQAYGVGEDKQNARVHGQRVVVLTSEFLSALEAQPAEEDAS